MASVKRSKLEVAVFIGRRTVLSEEPDEAEVLVDLEMPGAADVNLVGADTICCLAVIESSWSSASI